MNIAFFYPIPDQIPDGDTFGTPYDAIVNWLDVLARHSSRHQVTHARRISDTLPADIVVPMTSTNYYLGNARRMDHDLEFLRQAGKTFVVLHHNQDVRVQPTPGDYPSAAWTKVACERLTEFRPQLVRMPVLKPIVEWERFARPVVGTFGHIEPKKRTLEMSEAMRAIDAHFVAFGPDLLAGRYADYISHLRGFDVVLYPWRNRLEDCLELCECSHFIFVLIPPKHSATGGCPSAPRMATLFNRPIIVVDDEDTYRQDGYYVYDSLQDIRREHLDSMVPASTAWGVDEYLDRMVAVAIA